MSFLEDLKRWARGEDEEDEFEEIGAVTPRKREEAAESGNVSEFRRQNKVVNINATTQLSVILMKPDRFENASDIADHLRERRTVVLNLEQTSKEVARRLVDFISGVAYAQDGKIKKVANATFIITPYNVDLMGDDLIDELENNGMYI